MKMRARKLRHFQTQWLEPGSKTAWLSGWYEVGKKHAKRKGHRKIVYHRTKNLKLGRFRGGYQYRML